MLTGVFTACTSSVTTGGPYNFIAYVKHAVVLFVGKLKRVSRQGSKLVIGVHTPDGKPLSGPKLKVKVEGSWLGSWHLLGQKSPVDGAVSFPLKLPSVTSGQTVRLRVTVSGPSYRSAVATRTVVVEMARASRRDPVARTARLFRIR